MKVRCGHCKTDLRDASAAAQHVLSHEPKRLGATSDKALFLVRWDRKTGLIEELLSSPPLVGV